MERIHDGEPDTGEHVVRTLLEAQCPEWARSHLEYLATSGTDNAMWRVHLDGEFDVVARLPRRPYAAAGVLHEVATLRRLEHASIKSIVATPTVRHVGQPHEVFDHDWSVLEWLDGTDAWSVRDGLAGKALDTLGSGLARAIVAIGRLDTDGMRRRSPGTRGGPLRPLLERLDRWLDDPRWNAAGLLDVDTVRRVAAAAVDVADAPVTDGFVHGDLIPGNLLVDGNRLTAIIDWGGAGCGDIAQDLAPAWSVLTAAARPAFREAIGVDEATWIRGRTFELEHAVGGVLYYVPKQHPLGDVMARTLERILDDAMEPRARQVHSAGWSS